MHDAAEQALGFPTAEGYARMRERLIAAGFTPAGVSAALGQDRLLSFNSAELPVQWYRTRSGSPLDTLIRLFLLERSVSESPVRDALPGEEFDQWFQAGVLAREPQGIMAQIRLLPYGELYLASDRSSDIARGARADFTMSLGHATELLAFAAIPGGATTLDMATGCGALGLLAARQGSRVLATDISPRAIAFTQFNARLNGIESLEAAAGDMFGPAHGRQFDRILCNPPFVIAPQARYIFRDSGRRGDEFCREVARAAPELLAEGGYFQMLANCPHISGRDWRADWQAWFADLPCDTIVWTNQIDDVADYAATWIRDTETSEPQQQVERYDQWMHYYQSQQIEAVSYGVVTMRRRSGDNFILIDDSDRKLNGPFGQQLEQAFLLEDFFGRLASDDQLLDKRFRLAAGTSLTQTLSPDDSGELTPTGATIGLRTGIESESHLDPAALEVIRQCNGQTTLRAMLPGLADRFGIEQSSLAAALPQIAVQLARRGYLTPM